uniref:Uncharacterized protein n=1 Tax=Compsopogon caeruleus TaxID=31354 RepID=A0A7S1T5S5_9RHOD
MKVAWLIWIKDHQVSGLGEFGIEVTEEPNGTGKVRFSIPGIRESMMYWQTAIDKSSNDKGISLSHESLVTIRVSAVRFAADKISDVWERLWAIRGTMCDDVQPNRQTQMSLSAAAEIIEKKFNLENWNEELGLYSSAVVSTDHKFYFQSGWTGSMMVTLPLALNCVEPRTRQRAIQNVRTFLTQAVIPSSKLFHGRLAADLKKWTHDYTFDARPGTEHFQRLTLVRRQVDCLYFLLRQLSLFRIALGFCAPESWTIVLREACDALVSTWKRCGQLGFFLDAETGDVAIGNSASASLFPAALVHAAELFDDPGYWNLSLTVAEKLHQTFIDDLGLTCGGPGDALMCADSESAYYLLESLVCIAEKGKSAGLSQHVIKLWVEKARQVAALFATWVVSYDFRFPPESVFGKTEMKTNGTVWANVQNKHSSVGVCTNSGSALLRLFRLTEDERYLTLLSDITSALAQFVSREDRLLYSFDGYANPSGWVNERVNLSDWDPPGPGGIIHESSWCEVTILLSALEIPGIYVDSTNSVVYCLDVVQVTSSSFRRHDGMCTIECSILNPSKFPALVRIMIESREQRRLPLEDGYFLRLEKVSIPAGGEITLHRALPVSNTNS